MTTTASTKHRDRRLVLLLAAVLTGIVTVLLAATNAGIASAATVSTGGSSSAVSSSAAETRVGVSTSDSILIVGVGDHIAAGQGRGTPSSQSYLVSGRCVAAEDGVPMSQMARTGSALKGDLFHRSVSWVVDNPAARKFAMTGGDGVTRDLYQLPGELNGKPGVYEWIVDESGSEPVITHQRFIPGGSVTGGPNQ